MLVISANSAVFENTFTFAVQSYNRYFIYAKRIKYETSIAAFDLIFLVIFKGFNETYTVKLVI